MSLINTKKRELLFSTSWVASEFDNKRQTERERESAESNYRIERKCCISDNTKKEL